MGVIVNRPGRRRLPRPITIPEIVTLKTLADVRKLVSRVPKMRGQLSTWQHVETHLKGGYAREISVALMLVLQIERVPYTVEPGHQGRKQ